MRQENKDNTKNRPGFIPEKPAHTSPKKLPDEQLSYPSKKIQTK